MKTWGFNAQRFKKWLTVAGCLLMMSPISMTVCWANIGVYALSYIAVRGDTKTGVDTPWIVSTYYVCSFFGIALATCVTKWWTRRLFSCAAVVSFSAGLFLTYSTVKQSVLMLTVSVGVLSGLGAGLIGGLALQYAGSWAEKDSGLIISLVLSGGRIGTLFINPLFTIFVNPHNLSPDVEVSSIKLFSQDEVLDKVPLAFVIFGATSVVLQGLGVAFVRDAPDGINNYSQRYQSVGESADHPEQGSQATTAVSPEGTDDNNTDNEMSLRAVLTSPSFHCLCLVFLFFENATAILINYYKSYGAVWIEDDMFLAIVGIPYVAISVFGFSLWGYASDHIGVKDTLVYQLSSSSFLFVLAYFSPMISKWLYMANIVLMGLFLNPVFPTVVVATRHLFGRRHHVRNFCMVATLGIVSDFINPIIFARLLKLGWFYLFLCSGSLCTAALIIVILMLRRTGR